MSAIALFRPPGQDRADVETASSQPVQSESALHLGNVPAREHPAGHRLERSSQGC
jgi:hypothetical protein